MKNDKKLLPTKEEVKSFEMLFPMLNSDIAEIRELSKKKQDEPLNSFKVKIINKKLVQIKELLKNQATTEYLELLDSETLPTNSDAVLLLSQFVNAMKQYRDNYAESDSELSMFNSEFTWDTKD